MSSLKPHGRLGSGIAFAPPPPLDGLRGIASTVSYHAKQPRRWVLRQRPLRGQLDERLLNDVLGRVIPLSRKQLERGRVSFHESPEPVGIHAKVAFPSTRLPQSFPR